MSETAGMKTLTLRRNHFHHARNKITDLANSRKTWKPLHVGGRLKAAGLLTERASATPRFQFAADGAVINGAKNSACGGVRCRAGARTGVLCAGYATGGSARGKLSQKLKEVCRAGLSKILLRHEWDRGQRSGVQDCTHGYRQDEDHLALSFVSRLDHGVNCGNGRSAALGNGTWVVKGAGFCFAPETNCYNCRSSTPIRVATWPAPITSST